MTNLRTNKPLAPLATATALAILLAGCSTAPRPTEPDGSSRVPANDPDRVQALNQRVAADKALLAENGVLRAQVDVLQQKLSEMTAIVREALLLPPAGAVRAPSSSPPERPASSVVTPLAPAGSPAPAASRSDQRLSPQSSASPDATLPAHAYTLTESGVVIRVFHPFARTEFEPSADVAQALRTNVQGAKTIEVRGHTDSGVPNPVDKLIAVERAERARTWLINNGAEPSRISTLYFTSGHFFTENRTAQGRSLNRRVEIDIRRPAHSGDHGTSQG